VTTTGMDLTPEAVEERARTAMRLTLAGWAAVSQSARGGRSGSLAPGSRRYQATRERMTSERLRSPTSLPSRVHHAPGIDTTTRGVECLPALLSVIPAAYGVDSRRSKHRPKSTDRSG
jgi:hypothetical protein